MANMQTSTWSVTVMRGVAALCLALLCLARLSAAPIVRVDLFGAYALADGLLCGLAVGLARRSRERVEPLLAGGVGISVGAYLLASPRISPMALAVAMTVWGGVVGLLTLDSGYALYRGTSRSWRLVASRSGVRLRRGVVTECGLLLAGVVALALALAAPALVSARTSVSLTVVALFATAFGYLYLRGGLTLGLLALTAAGVNSPSEALGEISELEGGPA